MKAILLKKAGSVKEFTYRELDVPSPADNQVIVLVKAIAVNPVDYKVRMIEEVKTMICGEGYPIVLGWDIAGYVVSTGQNVKHFKAGDKVFGMVNFPGRGNAYAEFVAAPEDHLSKMPSNVSYEDAAATTLAALTALQAFKGNVKRGDKVLVHAASGGVGHFAVQLAKHMGVHVIGTSSAKNKDFILSLGADQHIDYNTQDFEKELSNIDFVLDCVGGDEMVVRSLKVIKDGGAMISLPSPQFPDKAVQYAKDHKIDLSFLLVESNKNDMETLKMCLQRGVIKPTVSHTFGFKEMDKAHLQLESGRTVGRVVVSLD